MECIMRKFVLAFLIIANILIAQSTQKPSLYEGRHFFVGFMQNEVRTMNGTPKSFKIYITSNKLAKVNIILPNGTTQQTIVVPQSYSVFTVDPIYEVNMSEYIEKKAIEITSDVPISVNCYSSQYQTSDIFAAIPVSHLGMDYYAITMPNDYYTQESVDDYNSLFNSQFVDKFEILPRSGEILIIGTQDNTVVRFTPSATTQNQKFAGNQYQVNLNKGQTYLIKSYANMNYNLIGTNDLTGTHITSTKPVGVISGHMRSAVLQNNIMYDSKDHLAEMLPPVQSWGTLFYSTQFSDTVSSMYKIVASQPNTVVDLTYNMTTTSLTFSTAGEYKTLTNVQGPAIWESNKPILISQFMARIGLPTETTNSDPSFVILPPADQYIQNVNFVTPRNNVTSYPKTQYTANMATLYCDSKAWKNVKLDGSFIKDLTTFYVFIQFGGNPYYYGRISLSPGFHNISTDSGYFGGIVYGTGEFDSYTTTLGSSLIDVAKIGKDKTPVKWNSSNQCDAFQLNFMDTLLNDIGISNIDIDQTLTQNMNYTYSISSDLKRASILGNVIDLSQDANIVGNAIDLEGNSTTFSYAFSGINVNITPLAQFGILANNDSATKTIVINNNTSNSYTINKFNVRTENRISYDKTFPLELPANDSVIVNLKFVPNKSKKHLEDTIDVEIANCLKKEIPISAFVTNPGLSPSIKDFGEVLIGDTVCGNVFWVNNGDEDIVIYNLDWIDNLAFKFDTTGFSPKTIRPNDTLWLYNVCFIPLEQKSYTLDLGLINDKNLVANSVVMGVGVRPEFRDIVIDWGARRYGTSNDSTLVVTNYGTHAGTILFQYIEKQQRNDANIDALKYIDFKTIGKSDFISYPINFTPQDYDSLGYEQRAAYFADWKQHPLFRITLKGSALVPIPEKMFFCFDSTLVGTTRNSKDSIPILRNTGNAPFLVKSVSPIGGDIAAFNINYSDYANKSLQPNEELKIFATFSPQKLGPHLLDLEIVTDAGSNFEDMNLQTRLCGIGVSLDTIEIDLTIQDKILPACIYGFVPFRITNRSNKSISLDSISFQANSFKFDNYNFTKKDLAINESYEDSIRVIGRSNESDELKINAYCSFTRMQSGSYVQIDTLLSKLSNLQTGRNTFVFKGLQSDTLTIGTKDTVYLEGSFDRKVDVSESYEFKVSFNPYIIYPDDIIKPKLYKITKNDTNEVLINFERRFGEISIKTLEKFAGSDSIIWRIELPVLVLLGDKLSADFKIIAYSEGCFENIEENSFVTLNNICIFNLRQTEIIDKLPYFEVYPNPSSDEFNLSFLLLGKEDVKVSAIDVLGKEILIFDQKNISKGEYLINVKNNVLINGLYVLSLNIGNTTKFTNLIISK